jgi:hypothetical protein
VGGLEVVDGRYRELYERARSVLGQDARVLAVELSGSVGDASADQWSDLDLMVITDPDGHEGFLAEWRDWLGRITPTVFARRPIAPFIINTLTPDGLTFDIAVYARRAPDYLPSRRYVVGMLSGRPFDTVGDALGYAVEEQLRGMAGPFISLVQRDEHLRHLTGASHLIGLLTVVFLAETGAAPPAKHWNRTFTEEQRAAAAGIPPLSATREGVIAFGLGVARLVIERARPLYPRYQHEWPGALAGVVARRVQDELGIDVHDWLF